MAVKVGSFAKSTNTSTPVSQAITGVGFKPRAVILWTGGTTGTGSFEANLRAGIGLIARNSSEAVTQASGATAADDNVADSNTNGTGSTSYAITICNGDGTVLAQAETTSVDSGGFTLNWTTNDANATIINYMAIGGETITDAAVVGWVLPTSTGNQAITGVGFQPDFVLHLLCSGGAVFFGVGAMTTSTQWATSIRSNDGAASSQAYRLANTSASVSTMLSNGLVNGVSAYVSMDADGFTTNCSNGHAAEYAVYSLCLKGGSYYVGNFTAASSGNDTITAPGFQPDGVLFATTARASSTNGATDLMFAIGGYDGTTNRGALIVDEYGAATMNTAGISSTAYMVMQDDNADQTIVGEGAGSALTATGFNIAWNSNAANLLTYIALATGAAGGSIAPLAMHYKRLRQ